MWPNLYRGKSRDISCPIVDFDTSAVFLSSAVLERNGVHRMCCHTVKGINEQFAWCISSRRIFVWMRMLQDDLFLLLWRFFKYFLEFPHECSQIWNSQTCVYVRTVVIIFGHFLNVVRWIGWTEGGEEESSRFGLCWLRQMIDSCFG